MARERALRLCQIAASHQRLASSLTRRIPSSRATLAAPPSQLSRRTFVAGNPADDDSEIDENASAEISRPPTQAASASVAESAPAEGEADEASARRAALLKRYGDRTATTGPVAVKVKTSTVGEDATKKAEDEANHNEIWGDYVRYMEHQRKKGWKT